MCPRQNTLLSSYSSISYFVWDCGENITTYYSILLHYFTSDVWFANIVVWSCGHSGVELKYRMPILPLSAATPPARAFSLAESRGESGVFHTCPESRLSVFKYSVFTTFQISNTEERFQTAFITPCFHVVFQEIFVTEATQGLSQKSKTGWINNHAHMYVIHLQNGGWRRW